MDKTNTILRFFFLLFLYCYVKMIFVKFNSLIDLAFVNIRVFSVNIHLDILRFLLSYVKIKLARTSLKFFF